MSGAIGPVVVVVTLTAACGPGYQQLEVDKIERVALSVEAPERRFCAYAPVALQAVVTYRDGKQARTLLPGDNPRERLRSSDFQWTSTEGTIDDAAVLRLPHDPLAWLDKPIRASVRVAARPEMIGEGELVPRFDCGGTLDVRGARGARGGELEDGGAGAPGPVVDVSLAYLASQRGRLVLVRVTPEGRAPELFVIDPARAKKPFVIDARGGDGGRGGQGKAGAYGAPGMPGRPGIDGPTGPPGPEGAACNEATPGTEGTDGGPGGPGGPGRHGGAGGPGGRATLRFDARFPELANAVEIRVEPGAAGEGGAGGPGGHGGKGGAGGRGGKLPVGCPGSYAESGATGRDGQSGPLGMAGSRGVEGRMGTLDRAPVEVTSLFSKEIARGIAVESSGAP